MASDTGHPRSVSETKDHTYRSAGVDLDVAQDVKERIAAIVSATHGPEVLGGVGGFGGLYELSAYDDPVLVSSTDGVGTKLKIAVMMDRYDTIGQDLVNLCVNDIVVSGARPLFFLDYIALNEMDQSKVESLVSGMVYACKDSGCALIGGETAQMPGVYAGNEFDLAGFVVGAVEKREMLDPSTVREGDLLVGIPSNGLHTNGYSLVRHVLSLDDDPGQLSPHHDELGGSLGDALLAVHRPYYEAVRQAVPMVKAMSHITGGGLIENVPRVLPTGLGARFDTSAWPIPPIFSFIQKRSKIERDEMYRVFNMGLGMVIACDPDAAADVEAAVPEARVVGQVIAAESGRRVVL